MKKIKARVIELLNSIGFSHTFVEDDFRYYYRKNKMYGGGNDEILVFTIAMDYKFNYTTT